MVMMDWCVVSQRWVAGPCPPEHEDCGRSFGPVNVEAERPGVLADLLTAIRVAHAQMLGNVDGDPGDTLYRAYGLATGRHMGCEDW